jgi:hypothetical protein
MVTVGHIYIYAALQPMLVRGLDRNATRTTVIHPEATGVILASASHHLVVSKRQSCFCH